MTRRWKVSASATTRFSASSTIRKQVRGSVTVSGNQVICEDNAIGYFNDWFIFQYSYREDI